MLIHSVNVSCVCYNSYSFPTICRKEELLVTLYQLLLVAPVTWSDVEDPQLQLPFPGPMRRFQPPLSWGVSGRMPTLTPGSWPFFSSTWPSKSGPCSTGSLCLVVIGLWGAAACSNQLKPRGEIRCWDAGMSHGPWRQEVSLAWNQELGSQEPGCVHFLSEAAGSPITCLHRPASGFSVCTGGRGRPNPIMKDSSVWMSSIPASVNKLLCVLMINSPERSRLAHLRSTQRGSRVGVGWIGSPHWWDQAGHKRA